jgi:hypothetical protein
MKTSGALVVLAGLVCVTACCDRVSPRIQPYHLNILDRYEVRLIALDRTQDGTVGHHPIEPAQDGPGARFQTPVIVGDMSLLSQQVGWALNLVNVGPSRITIRWDEAAFVDERGIEHTIYTYPEELPPRPTVTAQAMSLEPGERIALSVAPTYKYHIAVEGCDAAFEYREPLMPTGVVGTSKAVLDRTLDELYCSQGRVKLKLPVIEGKHVATYVFSFSLRERHARWTPQMEGEARALRERIAKDAPGSSSGGIGKETERPIRKVPPCPPQR